MTSLVASPLVTSSRPWIFQYNTPDQYVIVTMNIKYFFSLEFSLIQFPTLIDEKISLNLFLPFLRAKKEKKSRKFFLAFDPCNINDNIINHGRDREMKRNLFFQIENLIFPLSSIIKHFNLQIPVARKKMSIIFCLDRN